jgi:hypothetical protein
MRKANINMSSSCPLRRHDSARALFQQYADPDTQTIDRDVFEELHESIVGSLAQAAAAAGAAGAAGAAMATACSHGWSSSRCTTPS